MLRLVEPNDNDQLPEEIALAFTDLCNMRLERFRHGRVILASSLIALYRADRLWTERHMLPLFDWKISAPEARAAWEGFLWSPRLYPPLLIAFKVQFLDTAYHYADLGEHAQQYAAYLTYAALEPIDGFTMQDFQTAIGALPQKGLQKSAQALTQSLEAAGEQREEYWRHRVQPFWQHIWPKSRDLATPEIADLLVRLSIAAGAEFSAALTVVQDWLCPIDDPHFVVQRLQESGLCRRFPDDSLRLLNYVIDNQQWAPGELRLCMTEIATAAPGLERDTRYKRLEQYLRRHRL